MNAAKQRRGGGRVSRAPAWHCQFADGRRMQLTLVCKGASRTIALKEGSVTTLGRSDVPGAPPQVSARQAEVTVSHAGGGHFIPVLRNASANGTLYLPSDGSRILLRNDAARHLQPGDAFALCAADPELARVVFAAQAQAPVFIDLTTTPPAKRHKSTGDTPALPMESRGSRPLLLLLSGMIGSGKSTFAAQLSGSTTSRWCNVCQDTVRDGKPGSRADVLYAALLGLRGGSHVCIDRTNMSVEQRAPFCNLAAVLGCQLHALELAIPFQVCVERILKRTGHPHGVEGPSGVAIAHRWRGAKDNSSPTAREPFKEVTRCRTDREVTAAVQRYASLPPATDPVLPFAQPTAKSKLEEAIKAAALSLRGAHGVSAPQHMQSARGAAGPAPPPTGPSGAGGGDWASGLCRLADVPQTAEPGVVLSVTPLLVRARDKFPKARSHVLLISREAGLNTLAQLQPRHEALLLAMQTEAARHIAEVRASGDASLAGTPFAVGFHAVPSMHRLHCHVISGDYTSDSLKNRKHWHSFTHPAFFLPLKIVLAQLRSSGRVAVDTAAAEACLSAPMRCHRCGTSCPTIPALKKHIQACSAPVPPIAAL